MIQLFYDKKKIIAEVKCNIPVKGDSYGAAQKKGIIKDIKGLLTKQDKSKVNIFPDDHASYYKFMVVLDIENSKDAMRKIIKKMDNLAIVEYNEQQQLDTSKVYIVYIDYKN